MNNQNTIPDDIREKLSKVYALVNNGATEGERSAAKKALDRLVTKYKLSMDDLNSINKKRYIIKYSSFMELFILYEIKRVLIEGDTEKLPVRNYDDNGSRVKEVVLHLEYLNWVTLSCSFEYFRRHMKKEWIRVVKPVLNKCRNTRTRKEKRGELQIEFLNRYIIASNLYLPGEIEEKEISSKAELSNKRLLSNVEGGLYLKQVSKGTYLLGN